MLDNLNLIFEPNDDDVVATAYDIYIRVDDPGSSWPNVGTVVIDEDEEFDAEAIALLFIRAPRLLATVRRFVAWADSQPTRPRPNLDPIVQDAKDLLNFLDS